MMKNRIVENSLNEEKSFPVVLISFFHIWLFSEITSFQNSYSSKTSFEHLLLMEDKKMLLLIENAWRPYLSFYINGNKKSRAFLLKQCA